MLWVPTAELRLVADSQSGNAPATNYGTSVTPGNNTYSSYVSLLSATSEDSDWVEVNINSVASAATATDTLVTIGADPAGGTSYTDIIPHLLASAASAYVSGAMMGGITYRFPLRIKSGSTVAVKASQNNASPGAIRVVVRLYRQSRLDCGPRIGSYVKTFGEVTASSKGTDITPGTASEGAWTTLGSTTGADDNLFFWQVGVGINNSTIANVAAHVDMGIGDGTTFRTPILDARWFANSGEQSSAHWLGAYAEVASGDTIAGRIQLNTSVSGFSMIAYAVGG